MVSTVFCLFANSTSVPRDSVNYVSWHSVQFHAMRTENLRHADLPLSDLLTLGPISPFALWFDGL